MAGPQTFPDGDVGRAAREAAPERDENGRLTLDGMKAVIASGRSVFVEGKNGVYQATREDHLPTEAEYAASTGDAIQVQAAVDLLTRKRQQIDADLALLTGGSGPVPRTAPKPDDKEDEDEDGDDKTGARQTRKNAPKPGADNPRQATEPGESSPKPPDSKTVKI